MPKYILLAMKVNTKLGLLNIPIKASLKDTYTSVFAKADGGVFGEFLRRNNEGISNTAA